MIAATGGCAAVVGGASQKISVYTTPETNANCTLSNKRGSWTMTTPGTVTVERSTSTLKAVCTKAGWKDAVDYAASKQSAMALAGDLAFGLPEAVVDGSTGAGNNYPDELDIPMKPAEAAPAQVPASASVQATQIH